MQVNNIIISGFGGQGIVAAGKMLTQAGMLDGKIVSMLPSYGPEMRGGFANCNVILSDKPIASPIITMADVVVAMSLPALEKFESRVKPGGTLIVDNHQISRSDYRSDIHVIEIPATKIAIDSGNVKFTNVVMMGVVMAVLGSPTIESMKAAIREMLPKHNESLFEAEMKVLYLGMNH